MNPTPALDRPQFVTAVLLLTVMVLVAGGMAAYVLSDPGIHHSYRLIRAAVAINEAVGPEIDRRGLMEAAHSAIFEQLDPFSGYVNEKGLRRIEEELSGEYAGLGMLVVGHEQGLMILSVLAGGPAAEAHLLPGDIVIGTDAVDFSTLDPDSAASHLRGPAGTPVRIRVLRPAIPDTAVMEIARRRIPFVHVPFAGLTADGILYIKMA
ncbi:MAG: PDZ domain-containing protein, partial [Candidatus Zixiibacteriota bacterium]